MRKGHEVCDESRFTVAELWVHRGKKRNDSDASIIERVSAQLRRCGSKL